MANQTIDGNNNTQIEKVEGDVNISGRRAPIMREDDPDVVPCPFGCGQLTWWNAPTCQNCGRPVLELFQQRAREARRERLYKVAVISGLVGLALALASQFLPGALGGAALFVGVLGMLTFGALSSQGDRLK